MLKISENPISAVSLYAVHFLSSNSRQVFSSHILQVQSDAENI